MDNIDEQAVRNELCFCGDLGKRTLALLDAKDAQYAAAQAAMVEAVLRASKGGVYSWTTAPLQPHLPQPAPDLLVEAIAVMKDGRVHLPPDVYAACLRAELNRRGLHITEKKP